MLHRYASTWWQLLSDQHAYKYIYIIYLNCYCADEKEKKKQERKEKKLRYRCYVGTILLEKSAVQTKTVISTVELAATSWC